MAIVQISKLQQRAGNLVDLPQLDNAEFGWATDENRLFIGRTGNTVSSENIEVLTSYSNISFSQIEGSDGGNFNITVPQNGQILTYVSSTDTWENYAGNISQFGGATKLQLGDVANISMTGGAIGYVLETDGTGNLSWAPKGTLYTSIQALSSADPIIMTVANSVPYTNGTAVTISSVLGTNANTIVNGQSFYITLANDYSTSGNVELYTDTGMTVGANGTTMTATANTGIAISVIGGTGGGSGAVGGANTNVQFNDQNISNGVTSFTYDKNTTTLTVVGNINATTVSASSSITGTVLISNIATGTAPLTVTSTTVVPNLYVARANVSDYVATTLTNTGTFYPTFVNATSGNLAHGANANLSFNAATGALSATLLTGTLTTIAQPNVTSVGTLLSLTVSGNTTSGNLLGILANGTSNVRMPTVNGNINLSSGGNANIVVVTGTGANVSGTLNVTGNANVENIGGNIGVFTGNVAAANLVGPHSNGNSNIAITLNANIAFTSASNTVMTIANTGVSIANYTFNTGTGNANVGNLGTSGRVIASIVESNVATGTAPFTIASTTRVTNLNVAYANVVDYTAMSALTTGTYYPSFVSGTAAANYAQGSNTAFSANIANGAFIATTFVGALSGSATSANSVAGANVSGQVANALVAGTVYTAAQSNITSVGTLTSLTLANAAIISVGSNTNVGTFTGNFSLSAGSRLNATYADLAEYYEADSEYEAGTVLAFGGNKEVTIAEDETTKVAGVVSTNPAYVMNSACAGEYIVAIALQGRVPCKVRGTIHKGDMLVSGGDGYARPTVHPIIGSIIGKALENFEGEGIIEVAVGRL